MIFALASELHRLKPDDIRRVDHIIADDGTWSPEDITAYIARWRSHCILAEVEPAVDDWTRYQGELL